MSTYCERAGLELQTIRFSFDGTRINESDTPKGLDMEDGDTIEVFQQQSGGGSSKVDVEVRLHSPQDEVDTVTEQQSAVSTAFEEGGPVVVRDFLKQTYSWAFRVM
eukprot:GFUD01106523.1.p1 GENE.GFUD01106523.1~~GFUD01106523.1.p1  ORF type:complete len:106 (+),score=23.71 GFUD01106523.1:1-318(+)